MDLSYIIIPILVALTTQAIKLAIDSVKGNFTFEHLFINYGGMPSAHTAFAVSITTLVGLKLGIDDPLFGVSMVFTLLIMRDATAFRNLLGKQAQVFNKFLQKIPQIHRKDIEPFRERMGHSYLEVLIGAVWAVVVTYALYILTLI